MIKKTLFTIILLLTLAGLSQAGERRDIYVTGPDGLRHYSIYTDDRGNRMDIHDCQTGQTYHAEGLNPMTYDEALDQSGWLNRLQEGLDALDRDPLDW